MKQVVAENFSARMRVKYKNWFILYMAFSGFSCIIYSKLLKRKCSYMKLSTIATIGAALLIAGTPLSAQALHPAGKGEKNYV